MLEKKLGKYINGGCGTVIDLPPGPKYLIPPRTECGLEFVYCEACQAELDGINSIILGKRSNETKTQD